MAKAGTPLRALLVDDEAPFRKLMALALDRVGIHHVGVGDGDEALARSKAERFDVILLDVNLVDTDGWTLLEQLREQGVQAPVIFLTSHSHLADRVRGLMLGADDYIVKPFAAEELVARIHVVVRRHRQPHVIERGPLRIDLESRRVRWHQEEVELSPAEFDLIYQLAAASPDVVDRATLERSVARNSPTKRSNVVEVVVSRVRKKLRGPPAAPIVTVRGKGYRLELP